MLNDWAGRSWGGCHLLMLPPKAPERLTRVVENRDTPRVPALQQRLRLRLDMAAGKVDREVWIVTLDGGDRVVALFASCTQRLD